MRERGKEREREREKDKKRKRKRVRENKTAVKEATTGVVTTTITASKTFNDEFLLRLG